MARKSAKAKVTIGGLLGVGIDHDDGHKRVTRGEDFVLVGGSEETHEQMQEVAIQITEALRERGKRLRDAEAREVADLIQKALGL